MHPLDPHAESNPRIDRGILFAARLLAEGYTETQVISLLNVERFQVYEAVNVLRAAQVLNRR